MALVFLSPNFLSKIYSKPTSPNRISIEKKDFGVFATSKIEYPILTGFTDNEKENEVNESLKEIFVTSKRNMAGAWGQLDNEEETYECSFVADQINNIIVIKIDAWYYAQGTPHGWPLSSTIFIDAQTAHFYTLKDLLKKEDDLEEVRLLIQRKYLHTKDEKEGFVDEIDSLERATLTLSSDGIIFTFDPGTIAAYSSGQIQFKLNWHELDLLIDYESSFFKSYFPNGLKELTY